MMAQSFLRLFPSLASFLLVTSAVAQAASLPKSITISYEYLLPGSAAVKPLATIFYDPNSLKSSVSSWTPPLDNVKSTSSEPTSQQILRILLPNGSSTVASVNAFNSSLTQTIDLHLSPDGNVFSASVLASKPAPPAKVTNGASKSKKSKAKSQAQAQREKEANGNVQVNMVPPTAGPSPKLASRQPPVIGADGKEQPVEMEKTFFQKYWWVFGLVALFAMTGGGDK